MDNPQRCAVCGEHNADRNTIQGLCVPLEDTGDPTCYARACSDPGLYGVAYCDECGDIRGRHWQRCTSQ